MNRIQALMLLLMSSLASAPTCAALPADTPNPARPVAVGGYYNLTLNVSFDGAIRRGDPIICKAKVTPNLPSIQGPALELAAVQWKTAMAIPQGNVASCSFKIPVSWAITNPQDGAFLSYEIYGISASGSQFVLTRPDQGFDVAYPSGGGTSNITVNIK